MLSYLLSDSEKMFNFHRHPKQYAQLKNWETDSSVSFNSGIDMESPSHRARYGNTSTQHPLYRHLLSGSFRLPSYTRPNAEEVMVQRTDADKHQRKTSTRRRSSGHGAHELGIDEPISHEREIDEEAWYAQKAMEFDPDYDTSPEHLTKLFRLMDRNGEGNLQADEIRLAVANMGAYHDLTYIMQQAFLKGDRSVPSGGITCDQFVNRVRDSAARMFNVEGGTNVSMLVYDYSPTKVIWACVDIGPSFDKEKHVTSQTENNTTVASNLVGKGMTRITLEEFLKQPAQPPIGTVRWVGVTGVEPSLIIRLAHKYYIHPLQMEDALNPATERLKVDRSVKGIVHVLLAKITLKERSSAHPSRILREQVSIFLVQDTVLFIERSNTGVADVLTSRVTYAGSKIRLNGARFLVYSIVDAIVDQMFPIVQHFHELLVELQGRVHSPKDTPLSCVKAIQQANRDMNALQFYLRPLRPAVAQLVNDLPAVNPNTDAAEHEDLRRHLLDLLDHVVVLEEQAMRMASWSASLNEDYMNEQGHQMNKVMTILTMVTTAFLPGQFLAGVFGMNFRYMPELTWKYSYAFFWALILLLAIVVFNFYRGKKWL